MLVDVTTLGQDDVFDVCVVGTGPAGITCALRVAQTGKRVLLLEGGDRELTNISQDAYLSEVIGDPYDYLDVSRLRFFGGTSNHWAGWCRPLDGRDFESKLGGAGAWPIGRDDLDPFLKPALGIIDADMPAADTPIRESGLEEIHFAFSPPTRFNEKYFDQIAAAPNIFLALNTNLFQIEKQGDAVTGLMVKPTRGNSVGAGVRVRAQRYVLATGGIENNRHLLWSDRLANGGLVKSPLLGKYYIDHPDYFLEEALISDQFPINLNTPNATEHFIAPTIQTMRANKTLSCGLRIKEASYGATKRMIANVACVSPDLARSALSLLNKDLVCGFALVAIWEQEPVIDNHVALSGQMDGFGMARVNRHWRKSEPDKRTVRETALHLGKYLAHNDFGRVRLQGWLEDREPFPEDNVGFHHMGGTRMADSPEHGVVDANCRVFGCDNLYVAGSSVFPSGGHANPTLTIVQLALRLGEHLAGKP
jgi:choline dehydrogenase-like flavoprotein